MGRYCWSNAANSLRRKRRRREQRRVVLVTHGFLVFLLPSCCKAKNVGPRYDCTSSDLNLNSPGLTLHYPVPCSATGPSTGCAALGSLCTGPHNSGQEGPPCSGGDTARSRAADSKKFRAEAGPSLVVSHCEHIRQGILVRCFLPPSLRECHG